MKPEPKEKLPRTISVTIDIDKRIDALCSKLDLHRYEVVNKALQLLEKKQV